MLGETELMRNQTVERTGVWSAKPGAFILALYEALRAGKGQPGRMCKMPTTLCVYTQPFSGILPTHLNTNLCFQSNLPV